ncbi:HEAT repeat domain-containing protein, partial [Methanococcoides seepicolus]
KKRLLRAAAEAIGSIESPKVVDLLIKTLSVKDAYVRKRVVLALGKFNNKEVIDALKTCLNDKNIQVQKAAKKSLNQLR